MILLLNDDNCDSYFCKTNYTTTENVPRLNILLTVFYKFKLLVMKVLYSESASFEFWLGHWLSLLSFFMNFLSLSKKIWGQYLILGHNSFLPHPFQFVIH
jgi:hypothetical protein